MICVLSGCTGEMQMRVCTRREWYMRRLRPRIKCILTKYFPTNTTLFFFFFIFYRLDSIFYICVRVAITLFFSLSQTPLFLIPMNNSFHLPSSNLVYFAFVSDSLLSSLFFGYRWSFFSPSRLYYALHMLCIQDMCLYALVIYGLVNIYFRRVIEKWLVQRFRLFGIFFSFHAFQAALSHSVR